MAEIRKKVGSEESIIDPASRAGRIDSILNKLSLLPRETQEAIEVVIDSMSCPKKRFDQPSPR